MKLYFLKRYDIGSCVMWFTPSCYAHVYIETLMCRFIKIIIIYCDFEGASIN